MRPLSSQATRLTTQMLPNTRPAAARKPASVTLALPDAATQFAQRPIGQILLETGAVVPANLDRALRMQRRSGGMRLGQILISERLCSEDAVASGLALQKGTPKVRPSSETVDVALLDLLGADICIRHGVLPWRRNKDVTVVATSRPHRFEDARKMLEGVLGPVEMAIAGVGEIESVVTELRSDFLARLAEARPPRAQSVRRWSPLTIALGGIALPALLAAVALWDFRTFQLGVTAWAVLMLGLTAGLRVIAGIAAFRRPPAPHLPTHGSAVTPTVSLLVPLLKEADVSGHLIDRLSELDYPANRLEVCLVVEADDQDTDFALEHRGLPPGFRRIVVPKGEIRTKPRALNYALDFCRGEIIGIYDAEDAPERDQLRKVTAAFATAAPDIACLQARLSFYNARQNWLSRCFAIDYGAWFGVILPGLARAGFAIPLGGTGLFFRRAALEAAGRWDAHNVTEDADLGIRLARLGWRADIVDSTVHEEANCRALPWIRQRARWQKGYGLTYAVHMRTPRALWRDLGARRFLGFQILFLGSLSLALCAPLLWSFWLVPMGLPHPVADALSPPFLIGLIAVFLFGEAVNITVAILGAVRTNQRRLIPWIPSFLLYAPLASLSAFRAMTDLIFRPFFWDKTVHGLSLERAGTFKTGSVGKSTEAKGPSQNARRSAPDATRTHSRYGT